MRLLLATIVAASSLSLSSIYGHSHALGEIAHVHRLDGEHGESAHGRFGHDGNHGGPELVAGGAFHLHGFLFGFQFALAGSTAQLVGTSTGYATVALPASAGSVFKIDRQLRETTPWPVDWGRAVAAERYVTSVAARLTSPPFPPQRLKPTLSVILRC